MVMVVFVRQHVGLEHNLALVLILLLFMVELLVLVLLHNHATLKLVLVLVSVLAHHQQIILPLALQVHLAPSAVFLLDGPGLVPAPTAHLPYIVRRRELRDTLDINFSTENTKKLG